MYFALLDIFYCLFEFLVENKRELISKTDVETQ